MELQYDFIANIFDLIYYNRPIIRLIQIDYLHFLSHRDLTK
jgi:hypothetical protein